ncbi:carbohydrate ABC transporter permease [Roseiflexus sp.]|uniref:carbohydrate ABC transporter permease n=1 Tax=Roseiflexus sp. TaxID=2562120 RepID=UPI0021DDD0BE|nr:carbohydrate ABC transporter permease [Roseiflexus sp.]GIW00877.1 MAG: sugar ABC transporter ATP-binding protein [Roseiflexus sp.]
MATTTQSRATVRSVRRRSQRDQLMGPFGMAALYVVLTLGALVTAFPFYFMLVGSTLRSADILRVPPPLWFGNAFWKNYEDLLAALPFWNSLWNSVAIASIHTALVLFFCSLGGYGFAKFRFPGRNMLFGFLLATLMVPGVLGLIPSFVIMRTLGWIDTWNPLIIPGIANAFGIFWMRQYIAQAIPDDLIDAARIDGAHEFRIYWNIVVPVIVPALAALAILTFLGKWNEFQFPLLILKQEEKYTLPVALSTLRSLRGTEIGVQILGAAGAIVPILTVFILASRQFMSGLTAGAVKGT